MAKVLRVLVILLALVAFGATVALAQEFYVVKDKAGKMAVVDKKPADAASVVKGPFKTKDEAEKAMQAAAPAKAEKPATKPIKPPAAGC